VLRITTLIIGIAACTPDPEPTWALDPITFTSDAEGIVGFQNWTFFAQPWSKRQASKHHICTVVVRFTGTPSQCPECEHAWEVDPTILETDCPDSLAEGPLPLSMMALGIGAATEAPDAPFPGQTSEGWVDYGYGWERHGWAYPDALDHGRPSSATQWDPAEPFTLWPTYVWPL